MFIVLALLFSLVNYSQSPEKFTYQSIVRSADGTVLKSASIGIKLSVLKGTKNGIAVYSETHSASTNNNGLVTLIIGDGTSSDNFTDIDWSTGQYFLKVEVDPTGGISYSIEQTSQLLSVPYALYATRATGIDLTKDAKGVLPVVLGGTGSSTSPMIGLVTAPNASVAREMLGTTPVSLGGTGSTTSPMIGVVTAADAAAARTVLGVDEAGTVKPNKLGIKPIQNNYLSITDVVSTPNQDPITQELSAGIVPTTLGGTGATKVPMIGTILAANSAASRDSLGLGKMAIQNNDAIDIDGGAIDGTAIGANATSTGAFNSVSSGLFQSIGDTDVIIKTGNTVTGNITIANGADGNINIAPDGSGKVVLDDLTFPAADGSAGQLLKTDGSGNLSWIAVDTLGTDNSTAVTLATVSGNYLALSGQEITSGIVPISLGGTGSSTAPMVGVVTAADAAAARDSLALGTISIQNKDGVDIDGGAIDGTAIGANATSTGAFNSVSSGLFQSIGDTDVIIKTGNTTTGDITIADGADGNINITPDGTGKVVIPSLKLDITAVTSTGAELNILDGVTSTTAELNILDGVTSTTAEINIIDGSTTATSTTVVAGDQLILNDDGTMKQVALPDVAVYLKTIFDIDGLLDAKKSGANFTGSMLIGNETPGTLDSGDAATYNLGVGETALDALTTGDNNIALGYDALLANTTGTKNLAIGKGALDAADTESNNIAIGFDALGGAVAGGEYNVAIGNYALDAAVGGGTNEGDYNVAVGDNTLSANTTGSYNTATGAWALNANTTGKSNTGIGLEALTKNTTGDYNTGIGSGALYTNVSGDGNTAIGEAALKVSTGNYNTAVGAESLEANTGTSNTAVGTEAGEATTTGGNNVFVGADAGDANTTGQQNIIIGSGSEASAVNAENQIVIGYGAVGQGDNIAIIGNTSVTKVYASQDKGASIYAKDLVLENDETITNTSDGTVAISATTTSVSGDLTVTGNDITFGNGETISNATDGTVAITSTNTTVSGNLSGSGSISGFDANLNDQTGTTYTLVASDNGKVVALNNGSAITVTINTGLGDGFNCLLVQKGAGQVTISAGGGVTVANRSSETKTAGQYAIVSIINIGSEAYIISGDTGS